MGFLVVYFLIAVSFIFCLWLPLNGELIIQTDIARDFLLLEEIVQKRVPPLIGAHSGISGVFHGPLWFYINLPFFILGRGNPAVVGLFWVILYAISLLILFYSAKKLFNFEVAILSTTLYAMISVQEINNLSNPYGALILFPLFFYLFHRYTKNLKFIYLLLAVFILGLIIQFQMAFGIPILILTFLFLIVFLVKKQRLIHLASLFTIFFTQSTTILFELRHNFLQTRSLFEYLNKHEGSVTIARPLTEGLIFFTKNNFYLNWIFVLMVLLVLVYVWRKKSLKNASIYLFFAYFYFGYWFLMRFYTGTIWVYYHWAFIPVLIILFCSVSQIMNKKLFLVLFFIFTGILFNQQINRFIERNNYMGVTQASWRFIKSSAESVYKDAKGDFGYYVVSDDELGYQAKYAFHYLQQFYKKKAFGYEKKDITYAYIVPSSDKGYSADNYVRERIKIKNPPIKIIKFQNGVRINKYKVTGGDLTTPSDPNLINSMIFR